MKTINKNGYSLVEILIYLAIFTAVSILVINSFLIILSSSNQTNMNRKILESGTYSMERISREIRQATSIDTVNSTASILVLNSHGSNGSAVVVKFSNENGTLKIYQNNISAGNLLGNHLSLTNLIFRRIVTTQGEAVKIEMSLTYSDGKNTKTENFYDTIILRAIY